MTALMVALIRIYQLAVSPLFPACCRYYPSCSEYAVQALHKHGPFRGSYMAARRLLRCHPWSPGGYDPV
ncbi:MAG: membrane protein insertion efficiency factor YidD [Bacillota bacterium]|uniref:membrane protein insertion efficiency factor YidD n=1 Tax=Desulforudis sp. Tu-874 TaxID=3416276 RepID=UPI003479E95B